MDFLLFHNKSATELVVLSTLALTAIYVSTSLNSHDLERENLQLATVHQPHHLPTHIPPPRQVSWSIPGQNHGLLLSVPCMERRPTSRVLPLPREIWYSPPLPHATTKDRIDKKQATLSATVPTAYHSTPALPSKASTPLKPTSAKQASTPISGNQSGTISSQS